MSQGALRGVIGRDSRCQAYMDVFTASPQSSLRQRRSIARRKSLNLLLPWHDTEPTLPQGGLGSDNNSLLESLSLNRPHIELLQLRLDLTPVPHSHNNHLLRLEVL